MLPQPKEGAGIMTLKAAEPERMNEAFARAFNTRKIENLLALYEPKSVRRVGGSVRNFVGLQAIS
jgi:hypothetical protein